MAIGDNLSSDSVNRSSAQMASLDAATRPISSTTTASELETAIQERAMALAQRMLNNQMNATTLAGSGRIFTPFNQSTDVVENQKTLVTAGLFADSSGSISSMYTSSAQSDTSKQYYYSVYKDNPSSTSTAASQCAVAYGHRLGSGSFSAGQLNDSATKAIYSQYKQLLLNPGDTTFTFGTTGNSDSIYVINFDRARLRDRLDPGNWQVSLAELSGSFYANNVHTGSNVKIALSNASIISLIDDSGDTDQTVGFSAAGRVYNIISGTLTNGGYVVNNDYVYYGLAYPDMGMLVLDGNMLNASASFNTVTGSGIAGDNAWKLFTSISGAMAINSSVNSFQARNEEVVNSTHYFVRVKNGEYNFSNNPSFTTGSVGEFAQATFIGDPKTYITTVGMYNDNQELLAVAKLSKPIQKSFQNEALIKVKLDF
jgi:hypothetical protein